jgi:arabinogalactan endo-1,4-beta-galactosidase
MRRGGLVLAVFVLLVGSGSARAAVTQPPAPFDPSPLDGDTYYLVNQASGKQLDAAAGVSARSFSDLGQRWAMTKAPSGNWMISNVATGLCLEGASTAKCRAGAASQEWTLTYLTNGYYTIANVATGNPLDVGGTRWLPRATFWRGNDSSLQSKAESDRVFANNANAPWWHDAYLPGQDLLQILKNSGFNMVRVRPASINTTVTYGDVSFPITTAPYNNYTLAPPPASQIIPATANAASPGGTSSGNHAQTDWSAIDLAVRAKKLGMSVNVTLFYSGDNTAETPGNWAGKTVDQIAAVPGPMYDYVKQELLLFKANGAWPDLVSIGNEVNTGMFNTTGANGLSPSGTNCTPTADGGGTGTANCFPKIQRAAMQAIADAATDTSGGPALPAPLTCIHVDGNPDLQRFFSGATKTNGIPLDVACKSYYPGWHGPLTQRQQSWHPCNSTGSCGSTVQHIAEQDFATEANGLGLPIFTIEDGVSYTTQGSPQDGYYGINPPGPSRNLSRQGMIDLYKVHQNIPHNLSLGMEWWAGEATPIPGGTNGLRGIWTTPGIGLFDASTAAGNPINNATLPVMAVMGGRLDPTQSYRLVNAATGRVLESPGGSALPGAALGMGANTGITGPHQQWRILAQGADPSQNAATYPAPMDHRGDGFFQIVNQNGQNVLDGSATTVVQNPPTAGVFAIAGTNAAQEWDVMTAGNCGDIPANCTAPPLVSNGDGNFYVISNKATGNLLTAAGNGIAQQAPAAPSNGDWIEPASKAQLWRIVPARITVSAVDTTGGVGGTVPATLSLTLGPAASFGAFTPGLAKVYEAQTTADVLSTAGDATLSVSEPGHLTNGAFSLPQALQVLGVPKTYAAPVSHDIATIGFRQPIGSTDPLRTGSYSTTLTFTLSTTTP